MKKNPEEYYKQLPDYIKPKYNINIFTQNLKNLVKDLKKINITFYFIKLQKTDIISLTYREIVKNYTNKYLHP